MVYTDGVFHDEELAKRQIENLKRRGVRVVIVGLGRDSRKSDAKLRLEGMASSRSDVYLVNLNEPSLMVEQELNEVAQHVTTLECKNIYPRKLPHLHNIDIILEMHACINPSPLFPNIVSKCSIADYINIRAVARALIGGVYIHIFVLCPTDFF